MTGLGWPLFDRWHATRLVARALMLLAMVGCALAMTAPVAWWIGGAASVIAAALAAGLCLAGAAVALVVGQRFRGPQAAVYAYLFGMLFRLGVPLGAALALQAAGGALRTGGLAYWLVAFYLVTLTVETALEVSTIEHRSRSPEAS